jgi:L-Ala-D/L-Glu epimerase
MGLQLRSETIDLTFRDPFRIARALDEVARTVIIEIRDTEDGDGPDAPVGIGEGFPDRYYGETPLTVETILPSLLAAVEPVVAGRLGRDLAETRKALIESADAMNAEIGHNGAAKCAIDIALHDLAAKRLGIPLWELLGTSWSIPPTDFTLGIDEPAIVAERAKRAAHFPALKIKVGGHSDVATLEAVRGVFKGPIRVDANTGWIPDQALGLLPVLERLGVELIEQPFPRARTDQMRWLQERCPLPIVSDESSITIEELDGLVGVCKGVNVKLAKCGGVGPAHRMLLRARQLGFKTFLGCMEETSVGIAASAAVASLADWVDLDGCLLLADDPFQGLELDEGHRWKLGPTPGLGVSRKSA